MELCEIVWKLYENYMEIVWNYVHIYMHRIKFVKLCGNNVIFCIYHKILWLLWYVVECHKSLFLTRVNLNYTSVSPSSSIIFYKKTRKKMVLWNFEVNLTDSAPKMTCINSHINLHINSHNCKILVTHNKKYFKIKSM